MGNAAEVVDRLARESMAVRAGAWRSAPGMGHYAPPRPLVGSMGKVE